MGTLTPNAAYIYERNAGTVYAREMGAPPGTRKEIGWDYHETDSKFDTRTADGRPLHDQILENKMWGDIRRAARTNPSLQKAMEQCIIIYHLSKDHGNDKT